MALNIYNVLRRPIHTEKTTELINSLHKIVFEVDPKANKVQVKEALERLFNVKVKSVRIDIRKGKVRVFKRAKTRGPLCKRAIVTLKDSESFDILAQLVTGGFAPGKNVASNGTETT